MKPNDPTTLEQALRQLQANRNAARYRNPENGKRHHAHLMPYRPHFVAHITQLRDCIAAFKAGSTSLQPVAGFRSVPR